MDSPGPRRSAAAPRPWSLVPWIIGAAAVCIACAGLGVGAGGYFLWTMSAGDGGAASVPPTYAQAQVRPGTAPAPPPEVPIEVKLPDTRPQTTPTVPVKIDIVPAPLTLKPGDKKLWSIKITRAGNYDKAFIIKLTTEDPGILVPTALTVPASQEPNQIIEVEVSATADAKGGAITLLAAAAELPDPKAVLAKIILEEDPGPKDVRPLPPTRARIAEVQKLAEDTYRISTTDDKVGLARQLLRDAQVTVDPALRYVMLDQCRVLALQAGSPQVAMQAIAKLDELYRVNGHAMKMAAVETLARSNDQGVLAELVTYALNAVEDWIARDQYETAAVLLAHAEAAAEKCQSKHQPEVAARSKQVATLQKEYAAVKPAKDKLATRPNDPDANTAWGRFLLVAKGQKLETVLQYLARGTNPKLKTIAEEDLAQPKDAGAMAKLGDGWRELAEAEKGDVRKQFLQRAQLWYAAALPLLAGPDLFKVEKQQTDLSALLAQEFPDPAAKAGPFALRMDPELKKAALKHGGNDRSEAAVAAGLAWLSQHQHQDGRWNPSALTAQQKCDCGQPGHNDEIFGTAIALLAFLGAGETHQQGVYAKQVDRGLKWLVSKQKADGVFSGNGYTQGIAAIAICEAYGMTRDPLLKNPAQRAINSIVTWQGQDGGFRYAPKQNGDTSVSSWHIQALHAGELAGLNIPKATLAGVKNFLDKVSSPDGGSFGYINADSVTPRMTAAGMLCRQYTGWGAKTPGMVVGVERLRRLGPSPVFRDMYYYYYASQVMHNLGGEAWTIWNVGMDGRPGIRDILIDAQDQGNTKAHQRGSWDPTGDPFGAQFGRLGHTCMCILTLEIYYRYPSPVKK